MFDEKLVGTNNACMQHTVCLLRTVTVIKHFFGAQWLWLSYDVCCVLWLQEVEVAKV